MLPRAGVPGPQRGSAVDAVATVIACKGTGRLNGWPREAGVRADAGRAGLSCIVVRSARGLPDLEQDVARRVAPDPALRTVPQDAHEGVFEVIDSAMREAACSTLVRRPSLISPQVSRWRRRPPVHAMTVSTRPGASPATTAPPQCPRPRRRIDKKSGRSATATTTCTGSNSPLSTSASPRRGSSMLPARARPRAGRPNHGASPGLLDTHPNLGPSRPSAQEPRLATTASR